MAVRTVVDLACCSRQRAYITYGSAATSPTLVSTGWPENRRWWGITGRMDSQKTRKSQKSIPITSSQITASFSLVRHAALGSARQDAASSLLISSIAVHSAAGGLQADSSTGKNGMGERSPDVEKHRDISPSNIVRRHGTANHGQPAALSAVKSQRSRR